MIRTPVRQPLTAADRQILADVEAHLSFLDPKPTTWLPTRWPIPQKYVSNVEGLPSKLRRKARLVVAYDTWAVRHPRWSMLLGFPRRAYRDTAALRRRAAWRRRPLGELPIRLHGARRDPAALPAGCPPEDGSIGSCFRCQQQIVWSDPRGWVHVIVMVHAAGRDGYCTGCEPLGRYALGPCPTLRAALRPTARPI